MTSHADTGNLTQNGTNDVHVTSSDEIADLRFIHVDLFAMIEAEFSSGAILISFGAVLGVASPVQVRFHKFQWSMILIGSQNLFLIGWK